ncbi:hypothetical protein AB5I41_08105 [Sphingomonas sp. MMS24-JH45]
MRYCRLLTERLEQFVVLKGDHEADDGRRAAWRRHRGGRAVARPRRCRDAQEAGASTGICCPGTTRPGCWPPPATGWTRTVVDDGRAAIGEPTRGASCSSMPASGRHAAEEAGLRAT